VRDRGDAFSETEQFDLLLTDIVMPEMDGIELAQKASAIDPAIRVMLSRALRRLRYRAGGRHRKRDYCPSRST
jgi:two-component system cell cycle response regulator CpdR